MKSNRILTSYNQECYNVTSIDEIKPTGCSILISDVDFLLIP
ncbi:hypothetical protein ED5_1632 [Enterobacter roggenkampii]|nr:hypothetical protein ED5_1632 [Enterobacter roggenkampii]